MTKFLRLSTISLLFVTSNLYAHHPAADILDADIYEQIETMVADTPHATMTFEETRGMMQTSVTADSLDEFETLIDDEYLLEYVERLDGTVQVSMNFNDDSSVSLTINQHR